MKYAHYNTSGVILGWYDKNIIKDVPKPNVAIDDDNWQIALAENHNRVTASGITSFVAPVLTPDQVVEKARKNFLRERTAEVAALTVTVDGKVFNGDEISQSRMARAIISAGIVNATTTYWTLANNVSTEVTLVELQTALTMSMQAMAAIWVQE